MPEYKPALTEEENKRIEQLMKELEKVHVREKQIATELRRLIYKVEANR
jgi:hypothetical protein